MRLVSALAVAVAAAALAAPAGAVLQIAADINGVPFSCVDNNLACDQSPLVGTLQLADQVIGGVAVNGSIQVQQTGSTNFLNTSSLSIINTTGGSVPITLAVGGIDFVGPVDAIFSSGAGTFQSAVGSSITLNFYADTANTQGADTPGDTPGSLLHTFADTATSPANSFATSSVDAFVDPNLYSMTLWTDGVLTAGGTLLNRGQTMIETTAVPEPGSLLLLGTGLLGLGWFLRRRRSGGPLAA